MIRYFDLYGEEMKEFTLIRRENMSNENIRTDYLISKHISELTETELELLESKYC